MNFIFLCFFITGVFSLFPIRFTENIIKTKNINEYLDYLKLSILNVIKRKQLVDELSELIKFTRDFFVKDSGKEISSIGVMHALMNNSRYLRHVFSLAIKYLNMNDQENALKSFDMITATTYAKDFGKCLVMWDEIPSKDIDYTLEVLITHINEEKKTYDENINEMLSDIAYFPVVINCMLVLLNFIYIAFIAEQDNLLYGFFL